MQKGGSAHLGEANMTRMADGLPGTLEHVGQRVFLAVLNNEFSAIDV